MRFPSLDEWKEIAQGIRELGSSFKADVVDPTKRDFKEIVLNQYDNRYLKPGDVIGAPYMQIDTLAPFEHYGIYIGNDEVIHYATENDDEAKTIHKVPLGVFASRQFNTFFLIDFDSYFKKHSQLSLISPLVVNISIAATQNNYKNTSPEETITRAKSRLGEKNYSLSFNNCEHFAMWCKTGIAECNQMTPFHQLKNYRIYFTTSNYK